MRGDAYDATQTTAFRISLIRWHMRREEALPAGVEHMHASESAAGPESS